MWLFLGIVFLAAVLGFYILTWFADPLLALQITAAFIMVAVYEYRRHRRQA